MNKIPIRLYYKANGTIFTQGNLNSVPMLNSLSNYAYNLFLITPMSENDIVTTSFQKGDGTKTNEYPMSFVGFVPVKVGTTEELWSVYKYEIEDSVLNVSNYQYDNKIGIGFNVKKKTGETDADGNPTYINLNYSPYFTVCNYTINGDKQTINDYGVDVVVDYLNNVLYTKSNKQQTILKSDKIPELVSDLTSENYNDGFYYILTEDTVSYRRGDIIQVKKDTNGNQANILISKGNDSITTTINTMYSEIANNSSNITNNSIEINKRLLKDFTKYNTKTDNFGDEDYFIISNGVGENKKISYSSLVEQINTSITHYKGDYISYEALVQAFPIANMGDYAFVNTTQEQGDILVLYIWDNDSNTWKETNTTQYVSKLVFDEYKLQTENNLNTINSEIENLDIRVIKNTSDIENLKNNGLIGSADNLEIKLNFTDTPTLISDTTKIEKLNKFLSNKTKYSLAIYNVNDENVELSYGKDISVYLEGTITYIRFLFDKKTEGYITKDISDNYIYYKSNIYSQSITNSTNAPTTTAVKNYVDNAKSSVETEIENANTLINEVNKRAESIENNINNNYYNQIQSDDKFATKEQVQDIVSGKKNAYTFDNFDSFYNACSFVKGDVYYLEFPLNEIPNGGNLFLLETDQTVSAFIDLFLRNSGTPFNYVLENSTSDYYKHFIVLKNSKDNKIGYLHSFSKDINNTKFKAIIRFDSYEVELDYHSENEFIYKENTISSSTPYSIELTALSGTQTSLLSIKQGTAIYYMDLVGTKNIGDNVFLVERYNDTDDYWLYRTSVVVEEEITKQNFVDYYFKIGDKSPNLSNYYTKTEIDNTFATKEQVNGKVDTTTYNNAINEINSTINGVNDNINTLSNKINENANITQKNITVSNWASDTTYSDYGYRASISIEGVTSSMIAEVNFGLTEAISGNYAPICETYNGGIYIYSKVNTTITIPSIVVVK